MFKPRPRLKISDRGIRKELSKLATHDDMAKLEDKLGKLPRKERVKIAMTLLTPKQRARLLRSY